MPRLVAWVGKQAGGGSVVKSIIENDENVAYHAARLLLLISYCGKPRKTQPAIEGRTLLAKLDFFLRYPVYLMKAAEILHKQLAPLDFGLDGMESSMSVESRMVRFLYGPWDHIYYPALAYLIGKQLITIETKRGADVFRITPLGQEIAHQLSQDEAYQDLVRRAETTYTLFNHFSGTRLKDFIYEYFPEVVNRKLGETI